jgi:transcriptional regulator GlxA family with amidase domain
MKHISILVPKGDAVVACIEGSFKLFNIANQFLEMRGKPPLFKVHLAGLTREARVYDKFFTVYPDLAISEINKTDLIVIPAVNGDMDKVIAMNDGFLPWIRSRYKDGAEVASLCVGAFLLAATGLLKGKRCSTHWIAEEAFRRMFPDVNLLSHKIITNEQGLYTSGGATSFWNLLLYLIEKHTDREMAIQIAKYYEIEIDRNSQASFIMFKGQKDHDDEPIKRAQEFIESNFQNKITVDELASMLALSRRNLERRFKKATSNTVVGYIQRVKIEAAKLSLESSRQNINEVMYKVGYSDTKAFRTVFNKITGLSPVQYRSKYNREILHETL